jgi:phage tail sheath gpL-like
MGRITLPTEIVQSDKTPRTATALDKTSGVKTVASTAQTVLLVGQSTSAATVAASIPTDLLREDDGATYFGAGSHLDIACRAAFKANPFVKLSAVGVANGGTAATATVVFATTATATTAYRLRIGGIEVVTDVTSGDTVTAIGDALVAAILRANLKTPTGVTGGNASGTVTLTAKNGGTVGNGIQLRGAFDVPTATVGTTATLSGTAMGSVVSGSGSESTTAALAACTGVGANYNKIAILLPDSTAGGAAKTHTNSENDAEHGKSEIFVIVSNGTQSAATTLALALNANYGMVYAVNTSETWSVPACAAVCATMAREEVATRPYNTLTVTGILAPPVEKRWTRTETRTLLDNGCSPLYVKPGEEVAIMRAVSTGVKNSAGDFEYSTLDITKWQGLFRFRESINLMFNTNYPRARWADSDPDGLLPVDVATPEKVKVDLIDVARDMEAEGTLSNVTALEDQFVVEKVGTACWFSVPALVVDGMHEKLGKIVYLTQVPLAA